MLINQINIDILKTTFHNRKRYNIKEIGDNYIILKSRRNHLFRIELGKEMSIYLVEGNNKVFLRSFKMIVRVREFLNYMYKLGVILWY